MQSVEKLTEALRQLLDLVEDEAKINPGFAARLEAITAVIPAPKVDRRSKRRRKPRAPAVAAPDVFLAHSEKGDEEFRFWLRVLDLHTLRAIVRSNGFDPGKMTAHWTDADKYVGLIADQVAARLRRGSAFLTPRATHDPEKGSE